MSRHPARCPDCKTLVEVFLRSLYGDVVPRWSSRWPCRVDDLAALGVAASLQATHAALVAHRGFTGFVRAKHLPACDFYVPGSPGFLVEYDESQHFTRPRAITLAGLTNGHSVAFDAARWSALAASIDAHDNDPPSRDEKRAWYDHLRDVLPAEYGLGPTSRLHDRDLAYCALDPDSARDTATFRNMLNRP